MTHPARRIIRHYEKHAIAWAGDRQNSPWNDKVWHDRFAEALAPGESGPRPWLRVGFSCCGPPACAWAESDRRRFVANHDIPLPAASARSGVDRG